MTLLRTVLVFVIFVILAHLGLAYAEIEEDLNGLTSAIYSLGRLLEIPAQVVLDALPTASLEQQQNIQEQSVYFVGFAAAGGYFILYLLLGIGRR